MTKGLTLGGAACAVVLSAGAALADVPESSDPIKLVMNDWTGQHFSTKVAGALLEEMGYSVEYVSAGTVPQISGLSQGNLHFQAEFWTNNVGDLYDKVLASGEIVNMDTLGLEPKEGWIYPPYMEAMCPGLPSYQAIYDCAQAFAAAETFPDGRLITYPADWGTRSKDLVESIAMPLKPIPGGSEGAMLAELKAAYAAEAPILMMFWQPHWIFADLDMNWVEWNAAEGECVEESQDRATACGFEQASVDKLAWGGFEGKWPAAYKMLAAYSLSNTDANAAILEIDNKGRDLDEVVAEWVSANEATWRPWLDAAVN